MRPEPGDAPSFCSGLKQGLSVFNLAVSTGVGLAAGSAALLLAPGLPGIEATATLVAMLGTLLLHAGLHAYFGWRFRRGIQALDDGAPQRAAALLRVRERRGMAHYDPHGIALTALRRSRSQERNAES